MPAPATAFPIVYVCGSALLIACGLWVAIRRSRRRIGSEPRCPSCDYLLIGLSSGRCPECGNPFDSVDLVHGHRRGRRGRIFVGLVLAAAGIALSWRPVNDWSSSIYWYQYRPTYFVMQDLKHGDGLPPPANHPRYQLRYQVASISDDVDLARVALDELLRRDKAGTLPKKYREQIDEYALANLSRPATTAAVQEHLDEELVERLFAGKLSVDHKFATFQKALVASMTTDPFVMRWDAVPLRISFAPNGLQASVAFKSIHIDGRDVPWANVSSWGEGVMVDVSEGTNVTEQRWIPDLALGNHRIDLDMQINFAAISPSGRWLLGQTESRRLTARFTVITPTAPMTILRFASNPVREALHYVPEDLLLEIVSNLPDYFSNLAALEMIHRDRIGELRGQTDHVFVEEILEIQQNPDRLWDTTYGDYLELLRAAKRLTDQQWQRYERQQVQIRWRGPASVVEGNPLHLELVILPQRGDSKADPNHSIYDIDCSFTPDAGENWTLRTPSLENDFPIPQNHESSVPYVAKSDKATPGRVRLRTTFLSDVAPSEHTEVPWHQYDVREFSFEVLPRATTSGVK